MAMSAGLSRSELNRRERLRERQNTKVIEGITVPT